jgi:hypothetical protein
MAAGQLAQGFAVDLKLRRVLAAPDSAVELGGAGTQAAGVLTQAWRRELAWPNIAAAEKGESPAATSHHAVARRKWCPARLAGKLLARRGEASRCHEQRVAPVVVGQGVQAQPAVGVWLSMR